MFKPNKRLTESCYIKNQQEYNRLYKKSIKNPEAFWSKQAKENIKLKSTLTILKE